MIRTMQAADINKVAEIWLDTNLKAHDFIPPEYWKRVKQYLSTTPQKVSKGLRSTIYTSVTDAASL